MDAIARHFRTALRKLARSPLFTSLSILTLALGIGANSALFTVINSVLLRPLPYPESERLVGVWHTAPGIDLPQFDQSDASYLLYRQQSHSLEEMGIYNDTSVNLTGGDRPERLDAAAVSASALRLLGVPPAQGRGFREEEERPGAEPTVIVSHGLWQSRFGGDPGILGRTLRVDGVARTVVGVMPADFRFPSPDTQMWLPLAIDPADVRVGNFNYSGVARLAPGSSAADAAAELSPLVLRLPEVYPDEDMTVGMLETARMAAIVRPLRDDVVGDVGGLLWILLGSVGVILLIACANVANLFLVRAEGRQREVALRTALGATRGHVAGGFLAESTTLSVLAGVLGLGLAAAGVRLLVTLGPSEVPRLDEISIDGAVVGFTLAVALATSLLFGLIPALRQVPDPGLALKEGGRSATAGRRRHIVRNALVVGQIGLALVLLVGSGLLMRSFQQLRQVDPGFDAAGVLTLRLSLPEAEYPDAGATTAFYEQALERLRALPGVESAGAVTGLPLAGNTSNSAYAFEDFPLETDAVPPILATRYASPGYFETLGIPLVEGRTFEPVDHRKGRKSLLVSAALAQRFWPGGSALGKRLSPDMTDRGNWYTIVGVVGSVREAGLEAPPEETIYFPLSRPPGPDEEEAYAPRTWSLVLRAGVPPSTLAKVAGEAIWSLDANLPLANVGPLDELVTRARARTAFTMLMLSIAAGVALLLGAVGLYGVISYVVSERTQEIGVRMALGAGRGEVRRMVLRQALGVALAGIAVGLLGALGLTVAVSRLLTAFLYDVSPTDPTTFVAVPLLLLAIALAASYLPAQRAASVDPIEALHYE